VIPEWALPLVVDVLRAAAVLFAVCAVGFLVMLATVARKGPPPGDGACYRIHSRKGVTK